MLPPVAKEALLGFAKAHFCETGHRGSGEGVSPLFKTAARAPQRIE